MADNDDSFEVGGIKKCMARWCQIKRMCMWIQSSVTRARLSQQTRITCDNNNSSLHTHQMKKKMVWGMEGSKKEKREGNQED